MMPSTTRLTTAASPPALGCKLGSVAEGACCAATFAAAKSATETIRPKRVAVRWHNLFSSQLSERLATASVASVTAQGDFIDVHSFGRIEEPLQLRLHLRLCFARL